MNGTSPGNGTSHLSNTSEGKAAVSADELQGRHILVVDDEPDVLRVVSKRLERLGCIVDSATDGEDALTRLLANPTRWHVVLTDQTMPRRTGEQLLMALRDAGIVVPVVVMSGYSATVTPDRMLALGAKSFLPKPFDGAQLVAALSAAL
jgi:two-component system, cell cycle sensor histidine kinase and response regulator CckA